MNRSSITRASAAVAGFILLAGVAGNAYADEEQGDDNVDVTVEIAEITEPGVLAMTVAGTSASLTETDSTATIRQFTGALPTVTITDTRTPEEIPAGAGWYVLGTATGFTGSAGQTGIGADHLGWAPRLIDGDDEGLVGAGDEVTSVLDDTGAQVGLVDQELFAIAASSANVAEGDAQWTATADLTLKTGSDVAPGTYTALVTLSLFE
ncbi:hypothetical protein [Microbacterium sp. PMB16]|uniref:hypothetical protein n=1 Tax=Microbacterium sp. PMB16 TaxID=3120157 RepID=UPI003F4C788D